jgi:GNAT superfamily N-acetyltransferase
MASIETLRGPGGDFSALTFRRYREFLDDTSEAKLAVGARQDGRPIGLALATWSPELPQARLFSLMVDPDARRQSVGTRLLAACEALAAAKGRERLVAYHSSLLPAAGAFAATLRRSGWSAPDLLELRCLGRASDFAAAIALWPGVGDRLLKGNRLGIASWARQTEADAAEIRRLSAPPDCPPGLAPQYWAAEFQDGESIVLTLEGKVAGWMLACLEPEANGPPTLHIRSAYVRRDLWRSGILAGAYHEITRRHAERFGAAALVYFATTPSYPGMMALVRRRFAPAALRLDEWLVSTKWLARHA